MGGVSWGWDIFPDNPRREIGGRSITSEATTATTRRHLLTELDGAAGIG
jgi:hypothetical protein